jgi:hypothetical protein
MSGLILAGIGRGISEAGQTFGNAAMRQYEMDRREALEALREERQGAREEARETRAVQRVEDRALKDADIYAQAEKSAVDVGNTRRFEKFKKDVGQTDMAEGDLRKVFDEYYNQRKVGDSENAERYVERYSKQKEDVLGEIRRTGGSSGLITQATAELKSAREAERAADRLAFDQQREGTRNAQNERRLDLMEERITSQNKTDVIRANKPPRGGDGSKPPKGETTADLDRIVKRSEADAARILGVDRKEFNSAYARLQKKTDPASIALLEKVQPYVDELNDASGRLKNWKAGAPQSNPAATEKAPPKPDIASVKGVPSGSSVGNFVAGRGYEVKDRSGKVLGYVGK